MEMSDGQKMGLTITCIFVLFFGIMWYGGSVFENRELRSESYIALWERVETDCPELQSQLHAYMVDNKMTISEKQQMLRSCNEMELERTKDSLNF